MTGIREYYGRLEKAALEIEEQKEREPKYYITLWWGFDGLREDDGGVWNWVSRRKKGTHAAPKWEPSIWETTPTYLYGGRLMIQDYGCCQSTADMREKIIFAQAQNTVQSIQSGMASIEAQIAQSMMCYPSALSSQINQFNQCWINR